MRRRRGCGRCPWPQPCSVATGESWPLAAPASPCNPLPSLCTRAAPGRSCCCPCRLSQTWLRSMRQAMDGVGWRQAQSPEQTSYSYSSATMAYNTSQMIQRCNSINQPLGGFAGTGSCAGTLAAVLHSLAGDPFQDQMLGHTRPRARINQVRPVKFQLKFFKRTNGSCYCNWT